MDEETIGLVEMSVELFDTDLDDLLYEPEIIDDSCDESADLYGYYNN